MKCQKCGIDLPEKDIQLSHDVPKYMGGTDADGRHYLCKKCHDIYEKLVFKVVWDSLSPTQQFISKIKVKMFSIKYFGVKNV